MANRWDSQFLGPVIDKAISKHIEDLYVIKVGLHDAKEHLHVKNARAQALGRTLCGTLPSAREPSSRDATARRR